MILTDLSVESRLGDTVSFEQGLTGEIVQFIDNLNVQVRLSNGEYYWTTYPNFKKGVLEEHVNDNFSVGSKCRRVVVRCYNGEYIVLKSNTGILYDIEFEDGVIHKGVMSDYVKDYISCRSNRHTLKSKELRDRIKSHMQWQENSDGTLWRATGVYKNFKEVEIEFEDGTRCFKNIPKVKQPIHPKLLKLRDSGYKVSAISYDSEKGDYLCSVYQSDSSLSTDMYLSDI